MNCNHCTIFYRTYYIILADIVLIYISSMGLREVDFSILFLSSPPTQFLFCADAKRRLVVSKMWSVACPWIWFAGGKLERNIFHV